MLSIYLIMTTQQPQKFYEIREPLDKQTVDGEVICIARVGPIHFEV